MFTLHIDKSVNPISQFFHSLSLTLESNLQNNGQGKKQFGLEWIQFMSVNSIYVCEFSLKIVQYFYSEIKFEYFKKAEMKYLMFADGQKVFLWFSQTVFWNNKIIARTERCIFLLDDVLKSSSSSPTCDARYFETSTLPFGSEILLHFLLHFCLLLILLGIL